jgi:hypothetical protein
MNVLMIILRLIHILGGVFWAGTGFFLAAAITPNVKAIGPEGGKFVSRLMGPGKGSMYMGIAGTLTLLSGSIMLWQVSGHFQPGWFVSPHGLVLSLGALAGIVAWFHGTLVIRRLNEQLGQLGQSIQNAEGPPSPETLDKMKQLQEKLFQQGGYAAILMSIAVAGMAAAEYIWF